MRSYDAHAQIHYSSIGAFGISVSAFGRGMVRMGIDMGSTWRWHGQHLALASAWAAAGRGMGSAW